jgi:hypothetical protein
MAGNGAARRMLIEAAWSYRFSARIGRDLLLSQESLAKSIRDIAWKAQERLCRRYRKLTLAGKLKTVVTAAIARELSDFVWAIANPSSYAFALLNRGKNASSGLPRQGFGRPIGIGDEMVQGLMRAVNAPRLDARRNRLHALAFSGKKEPGAVGSERRPPIGMPEDRPDAFDVRRKSRHAVRPLGASIHRPLRIKRESTTEPAFP